MNDETDLTTLTFRMIIFVVI